MLVGMKRMRLAMREHAIIVLRALSLLAFHAILRLERGRGGSSH